MKYLYIVFQTALGALNNNLSKLVLNTVPLYHFMVIRQIVSLIISLLVYRNWRDDIGVLKNNKRICKSLIIGSLLGTGNSILFYLGLTQLPLSITAVLINSLNILAATALGVIFFKQKHPNKFYILILLLLPATALLIITDFSKGISVSIVGLLCLVGSAILYATSDHMTKGQSDVLSIQGLIIFKSIISILFVITLAIISNNSITTTKESLTLGVTLLLLGTSVNGVVGAVLHIKSIKELGATITTIFTSLTPVFSIVFALLLFNEVLKPTQWLGIAITVTVLYFIARVRQ